MARAQRPDDQPLIRRDAEGNERTASSWMTLTERLIREAQQDGEFDDLPGHGRPLRLADDTYAGDMAMGNHVLRNAGAAPPWIETDKAVRQQLHAIETLLAVAGRSPTGARARLADQLEALADAHDDAVGRLEAQAPTPRQQRPRLDRAVLRRRLRLALDREHGA